MSYTKQNDILLTKLLEYYKKDDNVNMDNLSIQSTTKFSSYLMSVSTVLK